VILTTHYMDEAEQLCDELVIVDKGQVVTKGSPQALLDEHFGFSYVYLHEQSLSETHQQRFDATLQRSEWVMTTNNVQRMLQELITEQVDVSSLRVRNPTLDDLFLKITGHSLRE